MHRTGLDSTGVTATTYLRVVSFRVDVGSFRSFLESLNTGCDVTKLTFHPGDDMCFVSRIAVTVALIPRERQRNATPEISL
jgi:hypothetical protein